MTFSSVASDYIVALNSAQFGGSYPSPECGKSITISYNGKSAVATIQDECPTCGYGELDLSEGLFDHFADESMGQFYGSWSFNDGSGSSPTTTTSKYVAPTSTYVAPTSTYTPPTSTYVAPTSTYTPPSSTYVAPTTSSTSQSSSSMSSVAASSSSASASIVPDTVIQQNGTTTTNTSQMGNLVLINQYVATLGHIVVVGASR